MNTLPPITVSTTDRDRLFAVLDNFKGDSDQIDYLYDELARANIVEASAMPEDVVTLGSRLRFRNVATGREHERVLTLPHETQTVSDAISILTPAAAAHSGSTELSSATQSTPVALWKPTYFSPASRGKPMTGIPGWRAFSAAVISRAGSSAYFSNASPLSDPAQLSKIFTTSAPASI